MRHSTLPNTVSCEVTTLAGFPVKKNNNKRKEGARGEEEETLDTSKWSNQI